MTSVFTNGWRVANPGFFRRVSAIGNWKFLVGYWIFSSLFAFAPLVCASDWPQLQANAARTGWTPDSPAPPFAVAYRIQFAPEPVGLVQPIIYKDVMYVPTKRGRLYAIAPETGERLWVQENLGVVSVTAAAADDLVYTGNSDGQVAATKADGGGEAWRADLGFSISAAPCIEGGRIYVGTRRGDFFCLDGKTGDTVWKTQLNEDEIDLRHFVWAGAAVAEGRVFVASDGDLRMFCLDAAGGKILWRSDKLPGVLVRDFCPVVTAGKVFIRVLPSEWIEEAALERPYAYWQTNPDVFMQYYEELRAGKLPDDFKAANERIIAKRTANPLLQTMQAFDAATGERPFVCGEFHGSCGWLMACPPGAIDSKGMMQVDVPFPSERRGQMDPATGRVIRMLVGPLLEKPSGSFLDGMGGNNDESHASSCGGDRVYWMHFMAPDRGYSACIYDVRSGEVTVYDKAGLTGRVPDDKEIAISLEAGNRREYEMSDRGASWYYTAAVPWKNMLFHHARSGLVAYREKQ